MKVCLLSHLIGSPGNRIFTEVGSKRGHDIELKSPKALSWTLLGKPKPGIDWPGGVPDLVFTRMGSSAPDSSLAAILACELSGLPTVNRSEALRLCRNKLVAHLHLQASGVPSPAVFSYSETSTWEHVLEALGPPPHVVKLALGTKGQGVMLTESRRSFLSLADSLRSLGLSFFVQRFVSEATGVDTRIFLVGGRAVGAARRSSQHTEEFRSNLHLGGKAKEVEATPAQISVAELAAQCLGLEVAGVDLLESSEGPLVLEVNGSPGLEASSRFAEALWDYLEERSGPVRG